MYHSASATSWATMVKKAIEDAEFLGELPIPVDFLDYYKFVDRLGYRQEGQVLGRYDNKQPHSFENTAWMTVGQATGRHSHTEMMKRAALIEEAKALSASGNTQYQIAELLHISRTTVARYLASSTTT